MPSRNTHSDASSNKDFTAVVGGVNLDIGGWSYSALVPHDSNPGRITITPGGVGRNIAHNLSLMGADVRFFTAVGKDISAQMIIDSCVGAGIDTSGFLHVPDSDTPVYLFISGPDKDMNVAVSDMEICSMITPEYLKEHMDTLQSAKAIVADANIPEETLLFLAEHISTPLFVDPVSTAKSAKIRPILNRIHTLKPNRLEAESLTGIQITDRISLEKAARALIGIGVQEVYISCGTEGLFACNEVSSCMVPICRADLRNATGAGDALMASLVWSYLHGLNLEDTAKIGTAAAAIAVESPETVNPEMSSRKIMEKIKSEQIILSDAEFKY